jgi:hypothetical protein
MYKKGGAPYIVQKIVVKKIFKHLLHQRKGTPPQKQYRNRQETTRQAYRQETDREGNNKGRSSL